MKAVTIKDVAQHAGVSPKTVSRVINGEPHVTDAVREKVLAVVAALDYRPNAFARSLSSSRSYLLGLFFDDPASGYAADVQFGALMRCRAQSYHLVVEPVDVEADGWDAILTRSIAALGLDGVILTPPLCDHPPLLALLEARGLPYVRIAPAGERERSDLVEMDDEAAAAEMTGHLIGLGHRRIGFVRGDPRHGVSARRHAGFLKAMAAHGLAVLPEWVTDGDFSFRSGIAGAEKLLQGPARCTAIFASNDDMALGAMMAAHRLGIGVPEGVSIAGFDDTPSARISWPQLTTVHQPKAEMAAAAVDLLIDPARRNGTPRTARQRLLDYSLVLRDSTTPLPERP